MCLIESGTKQVVRGLEVEGHPSPKQEINPGGSYSNLIGSVARTEVFSARAAKDTFTAGSQTPECNMVEGRKPFFFSFSFHT